MYELEEAQVQRQALLRDSSMRSEPQAEQRPEPFERVNVHLAEAIAIVIPSEFARAVTHCLVLVTSIDQAAVDVIFVGVD